MPNDRVETLKNQLLNTALTPQEIDLIERKIEILQEPEE